MHLQLILTPTLFNYCPFHNYVYLGLEYHQIYEKKAPFMIENAKSTQGIEFLRIMN